MAQIIRAAQRHFSDLGWLKTFWLFSFSDYYDPENVQFGALRVFNDDVVEPGTGFPTHPHNEMEIVTIVLEGEMTHEDSMGNQAVIRSGDVQRMSAGTGLTHSEFNRAEKPVHFYQIWIPPNRRGLTPSYDQKTFPPDSFRNTLLPVASGQGLPNAVAFHADATIYRSRLDAGQGVDLKADASRRVFVYVADGKSDVNGQRLRRGDQARIVPDGIVHIQALQTTDLIVIDAGG